MSKTIVADQPTAQLEHRPFLDHFTWTLIAVSWRNLWRNRRRTWITISSIAFAVWFLIFARGMQEGSFDVMIDNGAKLLPGHYQVQHVDYQDDPRVENSFDVTDDLRILSGLPGVRHVSARGQGFALVSAEERSYGAQIIGVDFKVESQWSGLKDMVTVGRYPTQTGEAMIGATLARNLGLAVGGELVILGTSKEGGIAALAATVAGIYDSAQPELNRTLVKVHIDDFREAWNLSPSEGHAVVAMLDRASLGDSVALKHDSKHRKLPWQELMRDTEQMREMKAVGTEVMFLVIAIIIGFSVVNTFMMVVFERTAEFGVLTAIGMRSGLIRVQLQLEAFFMAAVGVFIGFMIGYAVITAIGDTGVPMPIPEDMDGFTARFNMADRLFPTFQWSALQTGAAIMFIGLQLAAYVPGLRLKKLRPVEALRQET